VVDDLVIGGGAVMVSGTGGLSNGGGHQGSRGGGITRRITIAPIVFAGCDRSVLAVLML